jgi:hypothetical protein
MDKRLIRGYVAALTLLGFSGAWAATSGTPFPGSSGGSTQQVIAPNDPRMIALNRRQAALKQRAVQVRRTVAARNAAALRPAVRIVTLAPVTRTRTS